LTVLDRKRAWLVIPDRTLSDELAEAKRIVELLGFKDRVIWVQGSAAEGLTRREMIPLYSSASATFDDFGAGWFGSVVVEAMACECPVITYISEEVLKDNDNPPALVAQTAEAICARLVELFRDKEKVRKVGIESRSWIEKHHTDDAIHEAYRDLLISMDQKG